MNLATIDIGSNAIRLLISRVEETKSRVAFHKVELFRLPVRLGEEVFSKGFISDEKALQLIHALHAFKYLMQVYEVQAYRACATSAMREASNGLTLIAQIAQQTSLTVEIIDGSTEAKVIYSNQITDQLDAQNPCLYIDIGGGSTELSLFENRYPVASKSFNIGTLRLLHNQVSEETWKELKQWIKTNINGKVNLQVIGSGGNINKLYKMAGKKENKQLSANKILNYYNELKDLTVAQRMERYNLNPDRADVIVPAAKILLTILNQVKADKLLVPQIGVADGLVRLLYQEIKGG